MKKSILICLSILIALFTYIVMLKADCTAECTSEMECGRLRSCMCMEIPGIIKNCECSTPFCTAQCTFEEFDDWENDWIDVTRSRDCSGGGGGGHNPKDPQS